MTRPIIVWFRQDLRIADNPALAAAYESGAPVLPLYILDDETPGFGVQLDHLVSHRDQSGRRPWQRHRDLIELKIAALRDFALGADQV